MNIEEVVSEVKGRLEPVVQQGQAVVEISYETVKLGTDIVLSGVQELIKTQTGAAKAVFEASKVSFEKAKTDGLVAVASNPVEYIPDSRETLVDAFNDSIGTFSKTSEELMKVIRTAYGKVNAELNGGAAIKAPTSKKRRTTTTKARRTAKASA